MRLLDGLSPWVLPSVPGCPDPTLEHHMRAAVQRLCILSGVWLVLDDGQPTQAGVRDYEAEPPVSGAQVLRVRDAWLDGVLLTPASSSIFSRQGGAARSYTQMEGAGQIRLGGDPVDGQLLQMRLVLTPAPTAVAIPDDLIARHAQAIAHGALASLMLLPGQAWSNPQLAAFHLQSFETLANDARLVSLKDGVDGATTVHKRRFGQG